MSDNDNQSASGNNDPAVRSEIEPTTPEPVVLGHTPAEVDAYVASVAQAQREHPEAFGPEVMDRSAM